MDEKPKSIWKKSFTGRTVLVIWLAVAAFAVMLGSFIIALGNYHGPISGWLQSLGLFAGAFLALCLVLIYVAWPLLRWLFWKHWRRTLFALACFATLIALFYAEENWRGKRAWENYQREWEAKGEKFDFKDFVPLPVPDEQNFALTPIIFSSYGLVLTRDGKKIPYDQRDTNFVERIKMETTKDHTSPTNSSGNREKGKFTNLEAWQSYYRDLSTQTNAFPAPAQPQSPAADVLLALSQYDSTIEELRTASRLPVSRFPLNYDTECPAAILLPHLAALKKCSQVLQLRSLAELQNGQPQKALEDVTLALQLTDKIRTEPFLISHLVRIALLQIMLQPVWEGLAEHRWSEEQLVALDAELAKLDFLADYGFAMRGERGMSSGVIEYVRQAHNRLQEVGLMADDENGKGNELRIKLEIAALAFGPSGWYDQSKLRICRFFERWYLRVVDDQARTFLPLAVQEADRAITAEMKQWNPCSILERMLLPALGNAARKFAYTQESVDLARVAIALERYRLAHGEFPESLAALTPQFIATVPHDVIGGGPLKYRREANGQFVLYSVGWNEKDDGGVFAFKESKTPTMDISQGDWVWRYPAK